MLSLFLAPLQMALGVLRLVMSTELGRLLVFCAIAFFVGWYLGDTRADAKCEARIAASVEAAKGFDVKMAEQATARAQAQAQANASLAQTLQKKVDTYAKAIESSPSCALSDRDLDALNSLQ